MTEPKQTPEDPDAVEPTSGALAELPAEAQKRLEDERDALKDKYLRLAAEYDNFRKRSAKERVDVWAKAQGDLIERLVDGLDDLARFAGVDQAADAKTLHEGVELVKRKLWKALDGVGLVRIDQAGVPFDPKVHEAVTTGPAPAREQDHTVGAVLQAGYRLGDTLVRPARVLVLTWQGESS